MRLNNLFVQVAFVSMAAGLSGGAIAQAPAAGAAAAPAQHKLSVSKEAAKPIQALQAAAQGTDEAAFQAAVAAAQAVAKSADERYAIAQAQLKFAATKKDNPGIVAALQAMLDSGVPTAEEQPALLDNLARFQYTAKNLPAADAAFTKYLALKPNDTDALFALASIKNEQKQPAEAAALAERGIAARKAAGQPVGENDYLLAMQFGQAAKAPVQQMAQISRDLVTNYPKPLNWYYALAFYRDSSQLNRDQSLDLYRLMRASKAMALPNGPTEGDWREYATLANEAGLPGEAQSVLNEGIAARKVNAASQPVKDQLTLASSKVAADKASLDKSAASVASGKSALGIGDAYMSYGNYAKAAELYRTALQKGGIDAGTANLRLGIALAMAGNKAEAANAFKSVTGPSQQIAQYWALWVSQNA